MRTEIEEKINANSSEIAGQKVILEKAVKNVEILTKSKMTEIKQCSEN